MVRDTYHTTATKAETLLGRLDPWDTYLSRYDACDNIPPEAFAHQRVRGTIPDIDMRPEPDTTSQQFQDMASLVSQLQYMTSQQFRDIASLVSQLAFEVQLLKSNPKPPATAADNGSLSPLTPEVVGLPLAVVAVPLPIKPVVPTGEPVHHDSGARPKRQHTVKLENYAGQGASFEAFLANTKQFWYELYGK